MNDTQTSVEDKHEKPITIIVNGRPKEWIKKQISFTEVVTLAFGGDPQVGPNCVYTVTYHKGNDKNKEGTMVEGDSVHVKEGMVFNVTATNKS